MLSELDAVNQMLLAIGSGVTNTITGTVNRDVAACRSILDRTRTKVLLFGWSFNTDKDRPFQPDANGFIDLPSKALFVDTTNERYQGDMDVAQRGQRLYDRKKASFTFTKTVYLDLKLDMDWDDLPEAARHYIAAEAAEQAVGELDGDQARMGLARLNTLRARRDMMAHETSTSDMTIFDRETEYNIRARRR